MAGTLSVTPVSVANHINQFSFSHMFSFKVINIPVIRFIETVSTYNIRLSPVIVENLNEVSLMF